MSSVTVDWEICTTNQKSKPARVLRVPPFVENKKASAMMDMSGAGKLSPKAVSHLAESARASEGKQSSMHHTTEPRGRPAARARPDVNFDRKARPCFGSTPNHQPRKERRRRMRRRGVRVSRGYPKHRHANATGHEPYTAQ